MKPVLTITVVTVIAALAVACGAGSGMPEAASPASASSPPAPPAIDLAGTWAGTGVDSNSNTGANGTTIVTWTVTQTGADVSGTVTTQSLDPMGTTCHSCHRSRTGTLSGTVAGTTLTWTLLFPTDPVNDPTPSCAATLTGTISESTGGSLAGVYTGADSCEGQILNGTVAMARQP